MTESVGGDDTGSAAAAARRSVRLHRLTPEFRTSAETEPYEYMDPFGDGSPRTYERSTWISGVIDLRLAARSVVASWEALTPGETWIEASVRSGEGAPWLVLARWAETKDAIHRTTVPGQATETYAVADDEVVIADGHAWTHAQVRVTRLRPRGTEQWPDVRGLTLLASARIGEVADAASEPSGVAHSIDVPARSQQLYRDQQPELDGGGQSWCSPTAVTMVLEHWGVRLPDPAVPYTARHTYDHNYGGTGNWPFNTAFAARFGPRAFVTRLRSLSEAELFTRAGIPLVLGVTFTAAQLDGAGYDTNGHLLVLVGFDGHGDPIVNDPASHRERSDGAVRTTYRRDQFLAAWQLRGSGIAYVIHPANRSLPHAPEEANW